MYDTKTNNYFIPNKAKKAIQKCKRKNIRFIMCSLEIKHGEIQLSHYNILIIDLFKKSIERFEPYGWILPYSKNINNFIKQIALNKLDLDNYKYLSPENISQKIGIQVIADSYNGMCITISLLYLHLRIFNPNMRQKTLINKLLSLKKDKLKKIILRYAKYIEKILKKNPKYVLKLNNKL